MFESPWLYPCGAISQGHELRKQAINKHLQGVGIENRKFSKMSTPHEHTSYVVFLMKKHAGFASRGAYKQIIGTLDRR